MSWNVDKVKDLQTQKKEIEEKLEYASSDKVRESLEEELYNVNDSIRILTQGEQ